MKYPKHLHDIIWFSDAFHTHERNEVCFVKTDNSLTYLYETVTRIPLLHTELQEDIYYYLYTLYNAGIRVFLVDMERDLSTIILAELLTLREQFPTIKIIACIPRKHQTTMWSPDECTKYHYLKNQTDEILSLFKFTVSANTQVAVDKLLVDLSGTGVFFHIGKPQLSSPLTTYACENYPQLQLHHFTLLKEN